MFKKFVFKVDVIFLGLFLVGILLRLYAFFFTFVISRDSPLYLYQAMVISNKELELLNLCGFSSRIKEINFFSISIIPFYYIFKDWEIAGKFLSFLSSSLSIILLYMILKSFFKNMTLYLTLFIYVINPILVEESAEILRESYFTFLVLFGVFIFTKAHDSSSKKQIFLFAISNLFWLLATWIRIEGIILIFLSGFYLLIRAIFSNFSRKNVIELLSFLLLPSSLFLFGLMYFSKFYGFFITELKSVLISINPFNQPFKSVLESFKYLDLPSPSRYFWDMVAQNLWLIAFGTTFFYKFLPAINPLNLIFLVLGLKNLKSNLRKTPVILYFLILSIGYFLVLWFFTFTKWYMEKRYLLPFLYLLSPLIGIGIDQIKEFLGKKLNLNYKFITSLLILYILILPAFNLFKPQRNNLANIKEISLNIANMVSEEDLIKCAKEACKNLVFTREGRILFYISNYKRLPLCPKVEDRIDYIRLKEIFDDDIVRYITLNQYKFAVLEKKVFGQRTEVLKEALEKVQIKSFILE